MFALISLSPPLPDAGAWPRSSCVCSATPVVAAPPFTLACGAVLNCPHPAVATAAPHAPAVRARKPTGRGGSGLRWFSPPGSRRRFLPPDSCFPQSLSCAVACTTHRTICQAARYASGVKAPLSSAPTRHIRQQTRTRTGASLRAESSAAARFRRTRMLAKAAVCRSCSSIPSSVLPPFGDSPSSEVPRSFPQIRMHSTFP